MARMTDADTSTWVAFLEGSAGENVKILDRALEDRQVLMVPVVLTERQPGIWGTPHDVESWVFQDIS